MDKNLKSSKATSAFVRWTIVLAAFIITLTLIISWSLWLTIYKTTIDKSLIFFGDKTIAQGYGINFDFLVLSIVTLLAGILTFLFASPIAFCRKKNGFVVFLSLLNFVLSAIIIVSILLFVVTSYRYYGDFYYIYGLNSMLIVFLPWVIVAFADLFWIFSSLWNLISSANDFSFFPQIEEIELQEEQDSSQETTHSLHDEIITPTQPKNPPQEKPTKDSSSIVASNALIKEVQRKIPRTEPMVESQILDHDQVGPFAIYQENEKGDYVLKTKNNLEHSQFSHASQSSLHPPIDNIKAELSKLISDITNEQIEEVWNKGKIIANVNPNLYRKDYAGAWMFRNAFSKDLAENSVRSYAWTIVHHRPLINKGDNTINNLEPMNVTNAITKGQNYPKWKTKISSFGNENIIKEQSWKARF